jgi:HK97 family phage portal protein
VSWLTGLRDGVAGALGIINYGDRPQTALPAITINSSTWGDMFLQGVPGLPSVTEYTAQQISAAYACVNLIAGSISAMPLNVYRRATDGERDQLHDDDLWWLLNEEFLPRWGAANGWEFMVQNLLFHGNGYAVIHRQGPKVVGFEPIHRNRVTVVPTPDRMRLIYGVAHDMRVPDSVPGYEVYDQDDMIDIAGFGFDGFYGMSPLKYHLQMAGGVALAAQEFAARFFVNNGTPSGVISTDQAINQEKANELAAAWAERYSGLANSNKPAVLGNGAKFTPVTISAEDAQLLATRRFQVEEIARIYGVPPFMIGHLDKTTSWGSGVETMGQGFVRFTLRQHLKKIEAEFNRKLFRTARKFLEFDTFELESADMSSLFSSFATALGTGGGQAFMSPDEVRRKINLKKTPGGDKLPSPKGITGTADATEPNAQPAGA